jgi:hypothetical protein
VDEQADLEARIRHYEDVEAIKRLRYKYFRCLDSKLWDELPQCFAEHATASYVYTSRVGGKYDCRGLDAIMEFLKKVLGRETRISLHQGHHPEIELTGDTTAKGIWQLQDLLIDLRSNTSLRGASFYYDEYVKVRGQWKIKSIDSTRIFEEVWDRAETKSLKLTANMFAPRQETV